LRILDKLGMYRATADNVFCRNLEAVTGRSFAR
jgi:hypothetical protein